MTSPSFTRRRILAAVGSVGALYLGADRAGAALGLDPVTLNQGTVNGTYAASTEEMFVNAPPRIVLAWRELVNGRLTEETGLVGGADGETGSVGLIVDEAVVPGDSGSVTMRARLIEREEQETDDARLFLRFRLSNTAENGITEPEADAGDTTPNDGELQDYTRITIWKDDGFGTGNGELELGDIPVVGETEIASGTLAEVAESSAFDGGYQLVVGGDGCLSPGDQVYVSFEWAIPETVGNVIQGDSATFQVAFDPEPCSGGGG
ncbi:hypothetical protein [Haloplanus halophilus]|uniref:hypothetical protein n=1 Tax=Haloplanus halophilus TaxID=2949993 RepID=UPI002040A550|nr:hypothetical protein [Haloplanus sp. GDY1]